MERSVIESQEIGGGGGLDEEFRLQVPWGVIRVSVVITQLLGIGCWGVLRFSGCI